jgi:hypothetical protein
VSYGRFWRPSGIVSQSKEQKSWDIYIPDCGCCAMMWSIANDEFFPKTFRRHSARSRPSALKPSPYDGFSPWRMKKTVGFDGLFGFAARVVADDRAICACAASTNTLGNHMI